MRTWVLAERDQLQSKVLQFDLPIQVVHWVSEKEIGRVQVDGLHIQQADGAGSIGDQRIGTVLGQVIGLQAGGAGDVRHRGKVDLENEGVIANSSSQAVPAKVPLSVVPVYSYEARLWA